MTTKKYLCVALFLVAAFPTLSGCQRPTPLPESLDQRLHIALDAGNVAEAVDLVKRGADPDIRASNGSTTLMYAGNIAGTEYVEAVLARGTDVNAKAKDGWTPLMQASSCGNDRAAALLIAHGAKVNVTDDLGMTPLMRAAAHAYPETVNLLLQHGADVRAKDRDGKTILAWAREGGDLHAVKLIEAALHR